MAISFVEMIAEACSLVEEITVHQFSNSIHSVYTLIDVREPSEYEAGHTIGAINIPRGVLEMELDNNPQFKDRTKELVLMCRSGGRSALAALSIERLGFNNVKSLAGGYQAWEAEGLPRTH